MGLYRRKFTHEFKEAAVRRLELGASVAEVAGTCEVNANGRSVSGRSGNRGDGWRVF